MPAVVPRRLYNFPYWEFSLPTTITDLQKLPRNQTTSMEYRAALDGPLNNYSNYIPIYTDGSKSTNGCGFAMVTPDKQSQIKLPDSYNIFRCKTYAILQALNYIKQAIDSHFVIFTDSLSAIEAIKNTSKVDHITQEIHKTPSRALKKGKRSNLYLDTISFWNKRKQNCRFHSQIGLFTPCNRSAYSYLP